MAHQVSGHPQPRLPRAALHFSKLFGTPLRFVDTGSTRRGAPRKIASHQPAIRRSDSPDKGHHSGAVDSLERALRLEFSSLLGRLVRSRLASVEYDPSQTLDASIGVVLGVSG